MSLTVALLVVSLPLVLYAAAYWVALHGFAVLQAVRGDAPVPLERHDRGAVCVLVPSHREGAAVVDTVRSLVAQDYEGPVDVVVLVRDFDDATVAALRSAFAASTARRRARTRAPRGAAPKEIVLDAGRALRTVRVVATGHRAKHAKLNHALRGLRAPFVAFLDADHRAEPTWIGSALSTLDATGAAAVQCRKRPIGTAFLAQTWDALLSHGTFELFNHAQWRAFGRVFFTGSTAVFRARTLARRRFSSCITEDTYLSFGLLAAGVDIAYDPRPGSREETTPDVPSFVLRRRRWAAGHTVAFLRHLRALARGPAAPGARFQALVVGQFYLVPVALAAAFSVGGLYYLAQFTPTVRLTLLGLSLALAGASSTYLSWRRRTKLRDAVVTWLFALPHVGMLGALLTRHVERETYYFLAAFPFQDLQWTLLSAVLGVAVAVAVVAWIRLRPLRRRELAAALLSLPLSITLDQLSALLGTVDALLGRAEWSAIAREAIYVPPPSEASLATRVRLALGRPRRASVVPWLGLAALALFAANELFSVGPCGEERPLLWRPLALRPRRTPRLAVDVHRTLRDGAVAATVVARVSADVPGPLVLRAFLDGAPLDAPVTHAAGGAFEHRRALSIPAGWGRHALRVVLSAPGLQCRVDEPLAESVVSVDDGRLRVNGEPFVVKGMVPTFSSPQLRLPVATGYQQIHDVGANVVRLYHPPTRAILDAAAREGLLIVAQPESSTWHETDPRRAVDRLFYDRHLRELAEAMRGAPHALLLNAGNELDITDHDRTMVAAIDRLLDDGRAVPRQVPLAYSTFSTFIPYRAELLGVNMLDTGSTYWGDAVAMVASLGRPFFASELGGFVAFFEAPPATLRQVRLARSWERLLGLGSAGAVLYASHDNWAQAMPPGAHNDPMVPEQPDDVRGFWDERNRPKPELEIVEALFADLDLAAVDERVGPSQTTVAVEVRNRRPYALRDVALWPGDAPLALGSFAADERRTVDLPLAPLRARADYPSLRLPLTERTHAGLPGRGVARLVVPDAAQGPVVLSPHFRTVARTAERVSGVLLDGGELAWIAPAAARAVTVNGAAVPAGPGRGRMPVTTPFVPVEGLEVSTDGVAFVPFDADVAARRGPLTVRFRLPPDRGGPRQLVLDGVGADFVDVTWSDGLPRRERVHPYRDALLDLAGRAGVVTLRMDRRSTTYVSRADAPTGRPIAIVLAPPVVFDPAPVTIVVER